MNSTSIFVALMAVTCLFLQAPVNVRAKETVMPAVDDGGRIELGLLPDRPQREAAVRSFIWSHWNEKSRAKITVVDLTKEGDQIITAYDIGSDENGAWRMAATSRASYREHPGTPAHKATRTYTIYRVKRRPIKGPSRRLGDSEKTPPTRYRLVLLDAKGQQIDEL
jgi:hypothetical protein